MAAQLKVVAADGDKVSTDRQKALEAALAQIDRAFGKGSAMKLGSREKIEIDTVSTGSLGLDIALGVGGLPRGRVIEIYGPESSGKTTSTYRNMPPRAGPVWKGSWVGSATRRYATATPSSC